MAVYKYGEPAPNNERGNKKFIYDSLIKDGISRFLWSYYPNCDLNRIASLSREKMTGDEEES